MKHTAKVWLMFLASLVLAAAVATAWAASDEGFRAAPGGLRIKDIHLGEGPAAESGMVATIHFHGWVDEHGARGREIYNSRAEGRPVSFMIGTDGVMQGWNEGILGMRPGGVRLLLIPPAMGYGNREIEGVVPANAPLMFRIELIRLENPNAP